MLENISTYVEHGHVTPQVGYLYLLIAKGIKDKQELANKINATIRTVERNFRLLAELGLVYSKYGFYYAMDVYNEGNYDTENHKTTAMSPDLKAFKKQDLDNIYISRDINVELKNTAKQIANYLEASPSRVEETIKRAIGDHQFDKKAAFEACLVTRQQIRAGKVKRSPVGYFCIVLRNMYRSGAVQAFCSDAQESDKPCKEWEQIKVQLRSLVSKPTYYCLLEPAKANITDNTLILNLNTNIAKNRELFLKDYLELVKKCWNGEVRVTG